MYQAQDAYNDRYQKAYKAVVDAQTAYDSDPSEANAAALEKAQQTLSGMSEESDRCLLRQRSSMTPQRQSMTPSQDSRRISTTSLSLIETLLTLHTKNMIRLTTHTPTL